MKHHSALALLLLTACAHISSHPVTGAGGRQNHVATVACDGLSDADCAHVQGAVGYINASFGGELLRWVPGRAGDVPVSYGDFTSSFYSDETYAVTVFKVLYDTGVFAQTAIVVFYPEDRMSWASRQTMFRHELCHALGLTHSPWDRTSLMFPVGLPTDEDTKGLNDADLRGLRAIYHSDYGF